MLFVLFKLYEMDNGMVLLFVVMLIFVWIEGICLFIVYVFNLILRFDLLIVKNKLNCLFFKFGLKNRVWGWLLINFLSLFGILLCLMVILNFWIIWLIRFVSFFFIKIFEL